MRRAFFLLFAAALFASPAQAARDCRDFFGARERERNEHALNTYFGGRLRHFGKEQDEGRIECLGTYFADGSAEMHAARGDRFVQLFFNGYPGWMHDEIVIQIISTRHGAHFADLFYGGRERRHLRLNLNDAMFTEIERDWLVYGADTVDAEEERGFDGNSGPVCPDRWSTTAISNMAGGLGHFEGGGCHQWWIEDVGRKIAAALSAIMPACDAFARTDEIDELNILANCVWLRGDRRSAAGAAQPFLVWQTQDSASSASPDKRELFRSLAAVDVELDMAGHDPIRGADAVFDAWMKLRPEDSCFYMSLEGNSTGSGDRAVLNGRAWMVWNDPIVTPSSSAPFSQTWIKGPDGKWKLSSWRLGSFARDDRNPNF